MRRGEGASEQGRPAIFIRAPRIVRVGAGRVFGLKFSRASTEVLPAACVRTYQLRTTAALRDGQPANPRTVRERDGWPTLRSGHDLFDALYAMAFDAG